MDKMKRHTTAVAAAALAMTVIGPAALLADSSSAQRKNHWERAQYHRYYHRSDRSEYSTSRSGFPNYYPNIKYFRQNGHVYCKDLDTGEVYLSQW